MERLQRVLASRGIASRRRAETLIVEGRVRVDGRIVTELGTQVDPETQKIEVDGKLIPNTRRRYIVLNKPSGYITTTSDERDRHTVMELVSVNERVVPVGRLDRPTEGLLLFTNDGEVAFRVMHPRFELEKEYEVLLDGNPPASALERLRQGIVVDGERATPNIVRPLRNLEDGTLVRVVLHEGRNRIVRRMFEEIGYPVLKLVRTRIGPLQLTGIARGQWRDLTDGELQQLREALHLTDEDEAGRSDALYRSPQPPPSAGRPGARNRPASPPPARRPFLDRPRRPDAPERFERGRPAAFERPERPERERPSAPPPAGRVDQGGDPTRQPAYPRAADAFVSSEPRQPRRDDPRGPRRHDSRGDRRSGPPAPRRGGPPLQRRDSPQGQRRDIQSGPRRDTYIGPPASAPTREQRDERPKPRPQRDGPPGPGRGKPTGPRREGGALPRGAAPSGGPRRDAGPPRRDAGQAPGTRPARPSAPGRTSPPFQRPDQRQGRQFERPERDAPPRRDDAQQRPARQGPRPERPEHSAAPINAGPDERSRRAPDNTGIPRWRRVAPRPFGGPRRGISRLGPRGAGQARPTQAPGGTGSDTPPIHDRDRRPRGGGEEHGGGGSRPPA